MNKEEYKTFTAIRELDSDLRNLITKNETEIAKLQAQIDLIYAFIDKLEKVAVIESHRISLLEENNE